MKKKKKHKKNNKTGLDCLVVDGWLADDDECGGQVNKYMVSLCTIIHSLVSDIEIRPKGQPKTTPKFFFSIFNCLFVYCVYV